MKSEASILPPSMASPMANEADTLSFRLSPAGHVDNWLVAGPQAIPVADMARYDDEHPRPGILRDYHNPEQLVQEPPVEGRELAIADLHGPVRFPWRMMHCGADHFLDFTTFGFTCHYLRTWAYASIYSAVPLTKAKLVLTVNGPADVWVNGLHVQRYVAYNYQVPRQVEFTADLIAGENAIAVAFEVIAIRECPYALALQLADVGEAGLEALQVRLRTDFRSEQRSVAESALKGAGLDRSLFQGDDEIFMRWPEGATGAGLALRVRMESLGIEGLGRPETKPVVHWEGSVVAAKGAVLSLGAAHSFPAGRHVLVLEPIDGSFPAERRIPIRIARGEFSVRPYRTLACRGAEALEAAAARDEHPYGEIAKMALGKWDALRFETWAEPLDRLRSRADCSDFFLVGMLGALQRHGQESRFPQDLRDAITESALNFRYWMDEPGHDAMCFHTENHQILFHTCEVLAGQLFRDEVFSNSGQTGSWHVEKGGRLAMDWLQRKSGEGFQEWDSNVYFELDIVALSHLVDLAEDPAVSTMAAMVLDKIILQIALNSFHGVFGSTHGRVYTEIIKGARLEPTSGICRVLWGTGVFNDSILGIVSLACARNYHLPAVISDIALGEGRESWNRERHGGAYDLKTDRQAGAWEVNKATYKTAAYMLCSAQDYLPGGRGNQQHIWQATLGPDAVVFSTHPVCLAEDGAHRPNFWHGNGTLPRVAQWKNFVIILYNLPADDWMGFTHAYFPTIHFDEWTSRDGWVFARKNGGYIALYASCGLDLATATNGVREELRSHGHENVWLCQMGSAAQDGEFADFQRAVLEAPVEVSGLSVKANTIGGDEISFSWKGALVVNGQTERITGFPHYENPYCTSELNAPRVRIQSEKHWLEWDFARKTRTMGEQSSAP